MNNVRGFYSDDCEMTVGLMKALVSDGVALDKDKMLEAWRMEFELAKKRPPPAVPGGERQGHGSIKHVWRGKFAIESARERQARMEEHDLCAADT